MCVECKQMKLFVEKFLPTKFGNVAARKSIRRLRRARETNENMKNENVNVSLEQTEKHKQQ